MAVTLSVVETPETCDEVHSLYDEFADTVPFNVIFGIKSHNQVQPKYSPQDFLVLAKDQEGNVVGFAANKVHPKVTRDPDPSPERVEVELFLEYITDNSNLDGLPQKWIELRVLLVTESWRGRRVAQQLTEKSMELARAAGYKALVMCCVSEFTARLARRLGWTEHYRLAYADYPRLSGRNVQLIPNPPHDYVYFYYVDL